MTRQDLSMEVAADPRLLCAVRNAIRGYVREFGFPNDRADEIVLAVDEACSNAIRHAYGGRTEHTIHIALRLSDSELEIQIRDSGRPAPEESIRPHPPEPPQDVDAAPAGGLGLPIIYSVFDHVDFCPGEIEGNCITMRLRRPADVRAPQIEEQSKGT